MPSLWVSDMRGASVGVPRARVLVVGGFSMKGMLMHLFFKIPHNLA